MMIDRIFGRSVLGLLTVLPLLALLLCGTPASAQVPSAALPGAAPAAPAAEPEDPARQIQDLLATLEDPAARERLTAQLRTLLQAQRQTERQEIEPPSSRVLEFMSERVGRLSRQMIAIGAVFADLPDTVEWLQGQATDEMRRDRWIQVGLQLVLAVGVGFLAGAAMSRLLRSARQSIESRRNERILARLPLVILRTVIELVPIGVFAVAGYGTLSVTDPPLVVRLVALIVINATILIQLILALTRGVLAPTAPNLRMLPIGDESAHYGYIWARRLAYTAVYGYFISEAAYMLGLPGGSYEALLKLVGLVITGMLVILILQNRRDVAEWLRGRPLGGGSNGTVEAQEIAAGNRSGAFRAARRRLADVWHILAILYLVVIYGIWALSVQDGFEFMLRATGLSILVLIAARIVVNLIDALIRRGFSISPEVKLQFPHLEERANRYLPILQRVIKAVVWFFALLALLNAWGVDSFAWLESPIGQRISSAVVSIGIVLILAAITWEVTSNLIEHYLTGTDRYGTRIERSARVRTLLPLLRNAVMVVLITVVALVALSEIGVNIAPLLAGAGVIGLAIGFGSQTLVKDVITGLFILFEDTISVGDVVDVGGGHSGLVEAITIRTIKLRDQAGGVHSIPFSQVNSVLNLTKDFSYYVMDIGIGYGEDTDRVIGVIKDLGAELQATPQFGRLILEPIEILGVDAFRDNAVIIKARIKTRPIQQWTVGREFNRRMKRRFDELGIEIPFPQRTIHIRNDGQPPVAAELPAPAGSPPQALRAGRGG